MSVLCLSSSLVADAVRRNYCTSLKDHHHHHHRQDRFHLHSQSSSFYGNGYNKFPLKIKSNSLKRRRRHALVCSYQEALADLAPTTCAAYGFLLLSGGLFAYAKSGSRGSLFGGLTGAALMAVAYSLMQAPETKAIGDAVGFGSAFLFSSVFGIRLAATSKLIPAGPLLGLSICALSVFILAYLQDSL